MGSLPLRIPNPNALAKALFSNTLTHSLNDACAIAVRHHPRIGQWSGTA
jgi:hypothetical protein